MENPLSSYLSQVLLFSIFPFLFASIKTHFNTTLFYTYLGVILAFGGFIGQVWAVQLSDGIRISGGNIAYAAFIMTSILFVVLERDIVVARNIIILVIMINVFKYLLFNSMSAFLANPELINPHSIPPQLFSSSALLTVIGGCLIVFELLLFIGAFELIKKRVSNPFANILFFAFLFVILLIIDGILFPIINFRLFPHIGSVIYGGIKNKLVLGSSFAPMLILFLIIYRHRFYSYLQEEVKIEGLLGLSKEDLARMAQEATLRQKAGNVGLWDWDLLTNKVRYSTEWKKQIGYENHEIGNELKEWESRVHPEDFEFIFKKVRKSIDEAKQDFNAEFRLCNKNGRYQWILAQAAVLVNRSGRPIRMIGSHVDITDQKNREEELIRANKEKEVLLREVHHRVKNNLSVIKSLLSMQAERADDILIKEALNQSRSRVHTMGLVHDNLYKSEKLSTINLEKHAASIAINLIQAMPEKSQHVNLTYEIEDIDLTVDQAIPIGLVLNELLTNALKYAFEDDLIGNICISAKMIPNQIVELIVRDNGVGLPASVKPNSKQTLGLYIVSILSQNQLCGTLDIDNDNGASFIIRFPKAEQNQ